MKKKFLRIVFGLVFILAMYTRRREFDYGIGRVHVLRASTKDDNSKILYRLLADCF